MFLAVGSYQWTRLKDICLAECQKRFAFLIRHGGFRRDMAGCVMRGLRHGAYCVGCCWALMTLLFVGGVMNLLLDRPPRITHFLREGDFIPPPDCSPCWRRLRGGRCMVVVGGNTLRILGFKECRISAA